MEYKNAKSLMAKLAHQIKLFSLAVAALILCNLLLGSLLWHQSGRRDIVLVPSALKQKATISIDHVSASYLEAMAMMLVNDRLNITPENIQGSNENLLAFVDSHYYADFKKQLLMDERTIIHDKVSSSFYVSAVNANTKTNVIEVQGRLKRWVGERLIGTVDKRYQLSFIRKGNVLLLKSFNEIKTP